MTCNIELNQKLNFGIGLAGLESLICGWSAPEDGLVWSDGPHAALRVRLERVPGGTTLAISASPHLSGGLTEQRVAIYGNGLYIGAVPFGTDSEMTLPLPAHLSVSVMMTGGLELAFFCLDCRRPPASTDTRKLGIALHAIELRA